MGAGAAAGVPNPGVVPKLGAAVAAVICPNPPNAGAGVVAAGAPKPPKAGAGVVVAAGLPNPEKDPKLVAGAAAVAGSPNDDVAAAGLLRAALLPKTPPVVAPNVEFVPSVEPNPPKVAIEIQARENEL